VYALTVPVSGMKALREYFKELGNFGLAPEEVVTELNFDEEASYPKLLFKHKGYVPEAALGHVDAISQDKSVKIATRLMPPEPQALAGPAVSDMSAPAPAAVQPIVQPVVEQPVQQAPPAIVQPVQPIVQPIVQPMAAPAVQQVVQPIQPDPAPPVVVAGHSEAAQPAVAPVAASDQLAENIAALFDE
jgi:hypothetical protein